MTHFLFALLSLSVLCTQGANWSGFRGGEHLGVSGETNLPVTWSKEKNVRWKVQPAGWGDSSPIIVGQRVYLTAQTEDTGLQVLALDRDNGKPVWSTQIGAGKLKSHELQNMATPTPVADGEKVWALFGTGDIACLSSEGTILWSRQIQKDHGNYRILWGMGASPVLYQNKIFITTLHDGPSYVLALDANTGKVVWKTERTLGAKGEAQDSYSTAIIAPGPAGPLLVLSGADHLDAYDPATGKQQWMSSGLEVPHAFGRTIAGPTAADAIVVTVASGFRNQGYVIAVKNDGTGDITKSHRLWTSTRYAPDCPTPVIYQGHVYLIRDDGMASCLDLQTGKPQWQERLFSANVKVSPVAGDGKVYFLSGQANCAVVAAGPTLKILAQNNLDETTVSTPAIAHGQLFIRTKESLYCIREK